MKGKDVCPKDCPDRSPTCHAGCEKYLAFVERNRQERENRLKDAKVNAMLGDVHAERAGKIQRRYKHNIKLKRWG